MQALNRVTPMTAIHQVVPVGNEVAKRTSVVAKRNSAIHATTGLMIQFIFWKWFVHFTPIGDTHRNGATLRRLALPIQESGWFTHGLTPLLVVTFPHPKDHLQMLLPTPP